MTSTLRSVAFLAALSLAVVALPGCPCGGPTSELFHEDFESCDNSSGPVCGFAQSAGSASVVDGFTPGEHVLRVESGGSLIRTVSQQIYLYGGPTHTQRLSVIARCNGGSQLVFDQLIASSAQTDGEVAVPTFTSATSTLQPTAQWASYDVVLRSPTSPTDSAATRTSASYNQLFRLQLSVVGAGSCELDLLRYSTDTYGGFCE